MKYTALGSTVYMCSGKIRFRQGVPCTHQGFFGRIHQSDWRNMPPNDHQGLWVTAGGSHIGTNFHFINQKTAQRKFFCRINASWNLARQRSSGNIITRNSIGDGSKPLNINFLILCLQAQKLMLLLVIFSCAMHQDGCENLQDMKLTRVKWDSISQDWINTSECIFLIMFSCFALVDLFYHYTKHRLSQEDRESFSSRVPIV